LSSIQSLRTLLTTRSSMRTNTYEAPARQEVKAFRREQSSS
jgi:hypothetical protein